MKKTNIILLMAFGLICQATYSPTAAAAKPKPATAAATTSAPAAAPKTPKPAAAKPATTTTTAPKTPKPAAAAPAAAGPTKTAAAPAVKPKESDEAKFFKVLSDQIKSGAKKEDIQASINDFIGTQNALSVDSPKLALTQLQKNQSNEYAAVVQLILYFLASQQPLLTDSSSKDLANWKTQVLAINLASKDKVNASIQKSQMCWLQNFLPTYFKSQLEKTKNYCDSTSGALWIRTSSSETLYASDNWKTLIKAQSAIENAKWFLNDKSKDKITIPSKLTDAVKDAGTFTSTAGLMSKSAQDLIDSFGGFASLSEKDFVGLAIPAAQLTKSSSNLS